MTHAHGRRGSLIYPALLVLAGCVQGGTVDGAGFDGDGDDGTGGSGRTDTGNGTGTDTGIDTGSGTGTGTGTGTDTGTGSGTGTDTGSGTGTGTGTGVACTDQNMIADGGFEGGPQGAAWAQSSTNFGTPLCDGTCSNSPDLGPGAGTYWAWFGGAPAAEVASVGQSVTIPVGATTLEFLFSIPTCDGFGIDTFDVTIDGQEVFAVDDQNPACGNTNYQLVSIDISAFADGGTHNLVMTGSNNYVLEVTSFFVDEVVLMGCI